jgi:hypothetical protein
MPIVELDEPACCSRAARNICPRMQGKFVFPGGVITRDDKTLIQTGCARMEEEIGLPRCGEVAGFSIPRDLATPGSRFCRSLICSNDV